MCHAADIRSPASRGPACPPDCVTAMKLPLWCRRAPTRLLPAQISQRPLALLVLLALCGAVWIPTARLAQAQDIVQPIGPEQDVDSDEDGLPDVDERELGTSPRSPDTDGDGLLDGWEVQGYRNGRLFEPLHMYGADPLRKDIFVEIDWMLTADGSSTENARLAYQAAVDITRVFEDSGTGIRIHFDLGADIESLLAPEEIDDAFDTDAFAATLDTAKLIPFRESFPSRPGCAQAEGQLSLYNLYTHSQYFRSARRNLFYYVIIAEQERPTQAEPSLGDASFNAFVDDFSDESARFAGLRPTGVHAILVYRRPLHSVDAETQRFRFSSALLHELGHAFGLGHGGVLANGRWDNSNDRANYVSVMNYRYLFWGTELRDGKPRIDFSHGVFTRSLVEHSLLESVGMGAFANDHILANLRVSRLPDSPFVSNIDWDRDGVLSGEPVRFDLNANQIIDDSPSSDHDDWRHLERSGFNGIGRRAFRGCGLSCARGETVVRLFGDYDGDGVTDVAFARGDEILTTLNRSDERFSMPEGGLTSISVDSWELSSGDGFLVGNFRGEGRDALFIHRGFEASLMRWSGSGLELAWHFDGTIPTVSPETSSWELTPHDTFVRLRSDDITIPDLLAVSNGEEVALVGTVAGDPPDGVSAIPELVVRWRAELRPDAPIAAETAPLVMRPGRSLRTGKKTVFAHNSRTFVEIFTDEEAPAVVQLSIDEGKIPGSPRFPDGWELDPDDCVRTADVDGDGDDELILSRSRQIGLVDWVAIGGDEGATETQAQLVWLARSQIGFWNLAQTTSMHTGRLISADRDALLLSSGSAWMALEWNSSRQEFDEASFDRQVLFGATRNLPLVSRQQLFVGSFLPERNDVVLARDDDSIAIAEFTEDGFEPVIFIDRESTPWTLSSDDVLLPANLDGDPETELFLRKSDLLCVLDFSPGTETPQILRLRENNFRLVPATMFKRGDANSDSAVDIADAVNILNFLFIGTVEIECQDAADVDDNGGLDLSDPINLLNFLFSVTSFEVPPPGARTPGIDPTVDGIDCPRF